MPYFFQLRHHCVHARLPSDRVSIVDLITVRTQRPDSIDQRLTTDNPSYNAAN